MNDNIDELLDKLATDIEISSARLTANFINDVAKVFERDGFGATQAYLLEKQSRADLRRQASAVLRALQLLRTCPSIWQRRAIGRTILKLLPSIRLGRSQTGRDTDNDRPQRVPNRPHRKRTDPHRSR